MPGWREFTTHWIVSSEDGNLAGWSNLTFRYCEASSDNANWHPIDWTSHYSDTARNGSDTLATPGNFTDTYVSGSETYSSFSPTFVNAV
jgi:hypothetical protein